MSTERVKQRLRNKTYKETINLLQTYRRAAIVRPTGFGKTGILTRILTSGIYKNIVYLYPGDIIRQTVFNFYFKGNVPENAEIPHTTFMTYAKLVRIEEKDFETIFEGVDLIICDECHKLGATETRRAISTVINLCPDIHLCGATATPERMDTIDEIQLFFDNHVVSPYTLHNAFQDGFLQKPYYCFCSYGTQDINEIATATRLNIDNQAQNRENAEVLLRARMIEIANISRMDYVIQTTCDQYAPDTDYMKFIVFFSSIGHIHKKEQDVTAWFQDAYPDYQIRTLAISSENDEYTNNLNKLPLFSKRESTIDLIFCCDMLNMGYHINDLTGIMMYRGTESGIIYTQQLGRALTSGHNNPGIVFDVVDNLHREALYEVLGKPTKSTIARKQRYLILQAKYDENPESLTEDEKKEYAKLYAAFHQENWWIHANDIQEEDLIATEHMATMRELIAKTVAEPIVQRCQQAWKTYCEAGGQMLTRQQFLEQAILFSTNKTPVVSSTPLPPFCTLKRVTVEMVLDMMDITD